MAEEITYSMIRFQDVPAWWKIGWIDTLPGFSISIKNEVLEKFEQKVTSKSLIVRSFQTDNFLASIPLSLDTSEDWGFGYVFKRISKDDIFTTYQIRIQFYEYEDKKDILFKILASLHILTLFLSCVEIPVSDSPEPQLLNIALNAERGNFSITVELSKFLKDWLGKFEIPKGYEYQSFEEIEAVMREAWLLVFPTARDTPSVKHKIQCRLRPGGLINFCLPGDACDLGPNMCQHPKDGYILLPHNIDYSAQLIAFLAGIAKLCSLYRAANLK